MGKNSFLLILDLLDKKLLTFLQENAKTDIGQLCSALKLTKTPIYNRIKRLEDEKVIDKYVAVLKLGQNGGMVVFCSVSLDNQRLETIALFGQAVQGLPEVMECYLMGGISDFLLKVVVQDLDHYHKFSSGKLATIKNVAQIKSLFVLDVVKNSTLYPIY